MTRPISTTWRPIRRVVLEQRGDELGAVLHRRLDAHDRDTAPLLDFDRRQCVLATVDASGALEDVTERMLSVLGV